MDKHHYFEQADNIIDRSGVASTKWQMRAENIKAAGIIPFSVADMELPTAPEVITALEDAVRMGIYGYTYADEVYRHAVTSWFSRRFKWDFDPEAIVVTGGVVRALFALVREFTSPGDDVIVQPPVYYPFYEAITKSQRNIVENKLLYNNGRYAINFQELEVLAKEAKNTLMIFCSPHNPVGKVWDSSDIRRVAEICANNGVLLISDEIHCDLTSKKHTVTNVAAPEQKANAIVCTSTAKTFNLAGFTSSNIIIENPGLRQRYRNRLQNEALEGTTYFARIATIAAYTQCDGWVDALNGYIMDNYKLLKSFAAEHPRLKLVDLEGTYLAWLDMRDLGLSDAELEAFMNDRAMMSIDPGQWFGKSGSGFIRINIAVPRTALAKALERFGNALR